MTESRNTYLPDELRKRFTLKCSEKKEHSDVHRHERLQDGRGIFQTLRELLGHHPKRRLQHGESGRYKFQREH